MLEKPLFLCNHCGMRSGLAGNRCSNCGVHFAGVRCSHCNYEGLDEEFITGCPQCGYMGGRPGSKTPLERKVGNYLRSFTSAAAVAFFMLLILGLLWLYVEISL